MSGGPDERVSTADPHTDGRAVQESLELTGVSYAYRTAGAAVAAVREVSLQVRKGEIVAIQGPSGSGKSTVLAIAGGLLAPDGGQVLLDGADLYQLSEQQRCVLRRRRIGFIFQEYNLMRTLTALENVTLSLELDGVHRRAARASAQEALHRVGLQELTDRYPGQLSGGQQQRVAVARAWAIKPTVLLADEPTGALDQENAAMVLDLFAALCNSGSACWSSRMTQTWPRVPTAGCQWSTVSSCPQVLFASLVAARTRVCGDHPDRLAVPGADLAARNPAGPPACSAARIGHCGADSADNSAGFTTAAVGTHVRRRDRKGGLRPPGTRDE